MEKFEDLKKLQELKEKGVISEQEFEIEKTKILRNDNVKSNNDELPEKKIRIMNVIYGVVMFCLVMYEINALNNYLHSGETYYGRQMVSEYKMSLVVGIIIMCVVTFIWKSLISYFRKNEK